MSIFTVTAPLTIRYPDQSKKLAIEVFEHSKGLIFFEPFWHINGLDKGVHLLHGDIKGDGPWKIEDCVISVTSCHSTDAEMADRLAQWQAFLSTPEPQYPDDTEIRLLAQKLGAIVK